MYLDTPWYPDEEYADEDEQPAVYELPYGLAWEPPVRPAFRVDGMLLAAGVLALLMILNIFRDRAETGVGSAAAPRASVSVAVAAAPQPTAIPEMTAAGSGGEDPSFTAEEMQLVAAPYEDYTLTQGLHGYSYGHAAIDLAAGKGSPVLSPINGFITDRYVDEYGNPTLVIENDYYRVTLLHGKYSVEPGEQVTIGQQVGVESNKGYTTDMQGRPCAGRDCGYHTHLNIYDKVTGENANPLNWIEP